jgi:hypothetical protein
MIANLNTTAIDMTGSGIMAYLDVV